MRGKRFYRVANIETNQGLWYNWDGEYTGLIHNEFDFCENRDLPMPYDKRLVGWLSATQTLDDIWYWFPKEDLHRLQKHGWYLYEYIASKYKDHENHQVIDQQTSVPVIRLILSDSYKIEMIEQVNEPNIQHGRRSAVLQ